MLLSSSGYSNEINIVGGGISGVKNVPMVKKTFYTIEDIHLLEPFFFENFNDFIFSSEQSGDEKEFVVACEEEKVENIKNKELIFFPKQKNQLFWCIYVKVFGIEEYNTITNGFSNIEMEERTKIMNYFKENPYAVSKCNMKIPQVLLKELMSGLLIDETTSILSLYIYAVFYKINIYLVNLPSQATENPSNNTYIEFLCDKTKEDENDKNNHENDLIIYIHLPSQATEKPSKQPPVTRGPPANPFFPEQTNIFGGGIPEDKNEFFETKCRKIEKYKKREPKQRFWSVSFSSNKETKPTSWGFFDKMKKDYFKIDNVLKPLKGISNYKIQDLENILEKIKGEPLEKIKYKKQELYNEIMASLTMIL